MRNGFAQSAPGGIGSFFENIAEEIAPMHAHRNGVVDGLYFSVGIEMADAAGREREVGQGVD